MTKKIEFRKKTPEWVNEVVENNNDEIYNSLVDFSKGIEDKDISVEDILRKLSMIINFVAVGAVSDVSAQIIREMQDNVSLENSEIMRSTKEKLHCSIAMLSSLYRKMTLKEFRSAKTFRIKFND